MSELSFKIEVEETKTYWQRMGRHLLWFGILMPVVVVICISFTVHDTSNMSRSFLAMMSIFTVYSFVSSNWLIKYHVSCFQIQGGMVYIEYTVFGRKKAINGKLEDFTFIEKLPRRDVLEYSRLILVKYKGEKILYIGDAWGWKKPMTELVKFLKRSHLLQLYKYWWLINK